MPRTPAKSPGSKSTPGSKGKRDVVETPSRKPSNLPAANVEGDGVEESASDAAPEAESATVTPARKAGKRKAAGEDETPNNNNNSSSKKPKVYAQESVSTSESKGKKHTHTSVKLEIPVSTPTTKPAGKHIVFNDDEPSEYFTPQETPGQKTLDAEVPKDEDDEEEDDDDDESDSDDDAPEAVSTHTAAAQAAKSAQAATSAAEKQQELQKRKRQDRDARFKEQAEGRRKQAEKQAEKAAGEDADEAKLGLEQSREHIPKLAAAPTRKRLDKYSLPAVLPDDFLEAASLDGSDDEDDGSEGGSDAEERRRRRNRKARFNTVARQVAKAESRRPQDQRVGSTVYRVMKKQGDVRLAPKLGRQSRNLKDAMMGRGRPAAKKAGFLAKRR
ncbi:hypothetical protein VMCG_00479 [Cytospora schulzeri]|uniref:Uncharacterized protein n=1 Tax=Cytospora schulzeri TaxID=448051 RepID=A0A423XA01_9PEZI|nr:hypothetical protein VMCG_00479 [Valsa malicola]